MGTHIRYFCEGKQPGGFKGQTEAEKLAGRMEVAAEKLLEGVLGRRNWTVAIRDDLALALTRIVKAEAEIAQKREVAQ